MGRVTYVCTTCEEHFTRKYSAKRHNITVHHNNGGEIVTLVEYLVRRSSGKYQASDPSWYRRRSEKSIHKFRHATVADSMGNAFRPGGLQRQQGQNQYHQQSLEEQERYHRRLQQQQSVSPSVPSSPATIQDHPPDVLPCPTDRTLQSQSMNTTDDEETTTTLSQETRQKIAELKRLIYKYPQYHRNPGAIISCVIYFCSDGDNSFLDEKLEQLRTLDSAIR